MDTKLIVDVDNLLGQPDREDAASNHSVPGIHGEIEQSHFELVRVDVDDRHIVFGVKLDPNHRTHRTIYEAYHVFHKTSDVCSLRLQFLLARKSE
ncbi:hypothetical protein BwSH20_72040 [Bradyrhizobium ottawaense]|uniref:Uncharacterized protein n=1 Tax=Bradyrhizobium diazoefficiens TaxID=1355477 RepID=A0A809YZJ1_9BRAD|nr:hypothetical protein SG09_72470 [Bradyrhizobium ottawaense]BBZ92607.1 hypothetical protein F07S3_24400 [Bradyrhizobium diazoefficiens]GEC50249.1 hypothetical protein BJA01nite_78910 [Bradyrhizobium japonicum]BCA01731.1 hypothetical protein H12S4_26350 [Bradyrhizobium diazoefficiens]BCA10358.1 hypothetical protein BDHF08_22050 [Bradyrhizobium diazoefficiens]